MENKAMRDMMAAMRQLWIMLRVGDNAEELDSLE